MKNIGALLQETREKQGLSLEDINKKTRITVRRLQAIEEGDIAYFGDDISYVQYYVRLYAQALNLDFQEIKEDLNRALDDHNELTQTQVILERRQMEEAIRDKAKVKAEKKKIDVPFVSMAAVIVLLLAVLVFVMIKFVFPKDPSDPSVIPDDPYVVDPTVPDDPVIPDDPVVEVTLIIIKNGNKNYEVKGYSSTEPVRIRLEVGDKDTYCMFSINGTNTNNPAGGTYHPGNQIQLDFIPALNDQVCLHIGRVLSNKIYINDEAIEIDPQFVNSEKGLHLYFDFK